MTISTLWTIIAILSTLLVLTTLGLFHYLNELRRYHFAFTLWRNRAFRLRHRLQRLGGNWRFERTEGDPEDVP